MNVGIIGTGGRSLAYLNMYFSDKENNIFVKALCDIDRNKLENYKKKYFPTDPLLIYTDYKELLENEEIDTVLICTPDTTHKEISIAAMRKGRHILLEKPIATTLEDSRAIYLESLKHDKVVRLGFVLRYTQLYGKIKELVSSGALGRIITVDAKEMLDSRHAGSFYRRWHRFKANNGGLLNAKCSHDLDLLNWIIGAEPLYVSAFGGRSFFNSRQDAGQRCSSCKLYNSCTYAFNYDYYKENYDTFHSLQDLCVFNSEKDIVDHEIVNIQYENNVVAAFTLSMFGHDENRTMMITGTKATLYADFVKNLIEVRYISPGNEIIYKLSGNDTGHGGGDRGIFENLKASVLNYKGTDINDTRAGLLSTAVALAAEKSMEELKIINIKDFIEE